MGRRKRNKGRPHPRFRVAESPSDRTGGRSSQASSPRKNDSPASPAPSSTSSIGEAVWFAPALTAAYALMLAFTLYHHEMWRDEVQAWMLARDSTGPLDLFRNMEYETTPMLWHLLLMLVTRLTSSPAGMQILHWAIASTAVFVVARYAPFSPLQKILFAFGYFPLYEYGVMSRNYALGLLFIVVTCALLQQRHQRPLWLALVLVLMSNTSTHACIVAIGVLLALALDYWLNRRALAEDGAVDVRRLYAGFAVAAAGILLSVLQMIPPADVTLSALEGKYAFDNVDEWQMIPPADVTLSAGSATWRHSWILELKWSWVEQILRSIPSVVFYPVDSRFVPVVEAAPVQPAAVYGVWMAAALVAAVVAFHRRRPVALFLFLCLVTGLLFFFYAVHLGGFRHHGFLLISLLVLVWGGRFLTAGPAAGGEVRRTLVGRRIGSILLTGLLAMHAVGGLRAVAMEVERPFSLGKRTAEYIRAMGLESLPMLGYPDWSASAVVGHLSPQKRIHYLQGNREGSFVIYDGARVGAGPEGSIRVSTLMSQLQALAARNDGKVLMIFAFELGIPPDERRIRRLASFTGAIAQDENFHLYLYEAPANGDQARG